jgi:hypothetical protein
MAIPQVDDFWKVGLLCSLCSESAISLIVLLFDRNMATARSKSQKRKAPSRPRSAQVVRLYPRDVAPTREPTIVYPPPVYHPPVYLTPPSVNPQSLLLPSDSRPNAKLVVAAIGGVSAIVAAIVSGLFALESTRRSRAQPATVPVAISAPAKDPCAEAETHWLSVQSRPSVEAYTDHLGKFGKCAFAQLATLALTTPTKVSSIQAPSVPDKVRQSTTFAAAALPLVITGYGDMTVRWKGRDWIMPPKPSDGNTYLPCVKVSAPQWC